MRATDPSSSGLGDALLLRRVSPDRQHIAETMAGRPRPAGHTWWELADATADLDQPPAAVAVTSQGANQDVRIDLLATATTHSKSVLMRLLSELLATLRRDDVVWVSMSPPDEPTTIAALLAAGFCPAPRSWAAQGVYTLAL
jgi:hypothetical protein